MRSEINTGGERADGQVRGGEIRLILPVVGNGLAYLRMLGVERFEDPERTRVVTPVGPDARGFDQRILDLRDLQLNGRRGLVNAWTSFWDALMRLYPLSKGIWKLLTAVIVLLTALQRIVTVSNWAMAPS